MNLKQIVAANVRQFRKTHNMTQAKLAEELDLSLDMVSRMEREIVAPSFKTMGALCRVFRVGGIDLFGSGTLTGLRTDRALVLNEINSLLSYMSDKELKQAKKLMEALK